MTTLPLGSMNPQLESSDETAAKPWAKARAEA
jgi:hypothetical protein